MKSWGSSTIIGKDKLLYRAIKADKLRSVIFYGPPGTGKTDACKGDRQYDERRVQADQRHCGRQEGYGGSDQTGKGSAGNVREEDDSLYR